MFQVNIGNMIQINGFTILEGGESDFYILKKNGRGENSYNIFQLADGTFGHSEFCFGRK